MIRTFDLVDETNMAHEVNVILHELRQASSEVRLVAICRIPFDGEMQVVVEIGGDAAESTVKCFQVRDEGTHIPVCCVLINAEQNDRVWRRAGFGIGMRYVLLVNLVSNKTEYDPYNWSHRTLRTAHQHIEKNWDTLVNNQVVDVEYILGERETPKEPE